MGLKASPVSSPCLCHAADGACSTPVGHVIYHGPVNHVMDFFEGQGFRIPERKGIPDFLQEVTSYKDQAVGLVRVVASRPCRLWLPACHQDAACSRAPVQCIQDQVGIACKSGVAVVSPWGLQKQPLLTDTLKKPQVQRKYSSSRSGGCDLRQQPAGHQAPHTGWGWSDCLPSGAPQQPAGFSCSLQQYCQDLG